MEENKYTDEEVDYIVKKVRNHQANIGILIALAVMGLLLLRDYLS
jgi:hypothetical protein